MGFIAEACCCGGAVSGCCGSDPLSSMEYGLGHPSQGGQLRVGRNLLSEKGDAVFNMNCVIGEELEKVCLGNVSFPRAWDRGFQ